MEFLILKPMAPVTSMLSMRLLANAKLRDSVAKSKYLGVMQLHGSFTGSKKKLSLWYKQLLDPDLSIVA
jgi:hypothetical protein